MTQQKERCFLKEDYSIRLATKAECKPLLDEYHYLSKIQRGFKSKVNYGLIKDDKIVGVCIFTGFPVPELSKGLFGLERHQQQGLWELSRLCLHPHIQNEEHNITSWFVARGIKSLRKSQDVKAILSYADSDFHSGVIYKALGFDYYGLSDKKKDFWILQPDSTFKKHSRGKTKGIAGEWRDRSKKHRFLKVYDKALTVRWKIIK